MTGIHFRCMSNYLAEGNFPAFQVYIENRNVNVDDRDENGQTVLMLAAQKGTRDFVLELLQRGADVNAVDYDNWNALLNSAKEGHWEILRDLLFNNAILEHKDLGGWTALMWACYKGRERCVKLLLERGADPCMQGQVIYHISCLMWSSGRGFTEIVRDLLSYGAKVNVGDKYGTTALIWACRKGHLEIVDELLRAGANVDTVGMYLWTPLSVATMGNYADIVHLLLDYKPNVNTQDKDGNTALMIACKEGYTEIAVAILNAGAYVNVQDRAGDTNLIHAAKSGHVEVAEALIKKYADVDVQGTDKKTALYWAVEKNYIDIIKSILRTNPDMELATKDSDTPLMKATRNRNAEIVSLLLHKKCKVSAVDKKGDTALHIAMRARSKGIVEILLANPKNSQILYRPNRSGETPYNIDSSHQKTILGQIFGARRLNTNEDNENMLGYDLYSSALADFLSEPTLSMPICIGLYAKWGSGKSFLLDKLQDEMTNFARQWVEPELVFSGLLFLLVFHIAATAGIILGIILRNWVIALSVAIGAFILMYMFLAAVRIGIHRYDLEYAQMISTYLANKMASTKLLLMVLFCYPPTVYKDDPSQANPIKFLYTAQGKVSSTGSENTVAYMIASLFDALEKEYGSLTVRLYTVFKPKTVSSARWKWRRVCCIPNFLIFYGTLICTIVTAALMVSHKVTFFNGDDKMFTEGHAPIHAAIIALITIIGVIIVANLYTWIQMLTALIYPTNKRLFRSIAKAQAFKMDELQAQNSYAQLLTEVVQCMDAFTGNQTRLVIVVDGLDSCEQEKVLHNLDAVHVLFSNPSTPFITLLAIDPHIIIKAIENNINRVFNDLNINGHDYLRNIVHLPFYLQNSGMRRVRVAQRIAAKKMNNHWGVDERESFSLGSGLGMSSRRFSSESSMSIPDRFKQSQRKNSKKLRMSESVASSMGNINSRVTGAQDLTKVLLTDDYFSDVNPRSMRRLMNVVYITGRLLKAFNIEFNWYHLATWVNITEQWPYRTSWITLYFEKNEDETEDNMSLKAVYDKLSDQIPTSKEVEPLLEIDRDERKFEIFLSYHKGSLQIADLKMFLPFTINLDPYIRKMIKEEQQNSDDLTGQSVLSMVPQSNLSTVSTMANWPSAENKNVIRKISRTNAHRVHPFASAPVMCPIPSQMSSTVTPVMWAPYPPTPTAANNSASNIFRNTLPSTLTEVTLSQLAVTEIMELLKTLDGINKNAVNTYCNALSENNISGRVLFYCDLDELKKVLNMSFGDWELFRLTILSLRDSEMNLMELGEGDMQNKNVHFSKPTAKKEITQVIPTQTTNNFIKSPREPPQNSKNPPKTPAEPTTEKVSRERSSSIKRTGQQNTLEKQVTLEEQMIMGALQTLSEDAQEDALESMTMQDTTAHPSGSTLSPILSDPDEAVDALSDDESVLSSTYAETDVLFIHSPHHDDRTLSPKRVQVISTSEQCWARTPSPTPPTASFFITSDFSSQASGIDGVGFEESEVPLKRPIRPSNINVTPAVSFECLNKLKSKVLSSISPSKAIQLKRREDVKKSTPVGSDSDLSESTPLVSAMKPPKTDQKATLRSETLTLTTPTPNIGEKQKVSESNEKYFNFHSPQVSQAKIYRGSVSFDEPSDGVVRADSSELDLKRNLTVPRDLDFTSVPVTSTCDSQLIEVITSTETVL
uniref:Uncharacterized protein n=1 Tax=Strigamia maritima TaxID=126957 RepID=T1J258_STRMM